MLDSISQCEKNNPKLFCDMVNRLRSRKKKNWQITLILRNGINGLGILNRSQVTIYKWDKTIKGVVKRLKDFTCFSEGLGKNIVNDEIIKASRRLRNHKAVGMTQSVMR